MRRRIYWLLPDLASARRTTDDLLLARINERHVHFVAREDADMTGLHQANVLQTSDVIRAAEMGLVVGGSAGSMIGVSVPSQRLKRFTPQIEQGQILLMVDVPNSRVQEIEARLEALHPEAHL